MAMFIIHSSDGWVPSLFVPWFAFPRRVRRTPSPWQRLTKFQNNFSSAVYLILEDHKTRLLKKDAAILKPSSSKFILCCTIPSIRFIITEPNLFTSLSLASWLKAVFKMSNNSTSLKF